MSSLFPEYAPPQPAEPRPPKPPRRPVGRVRMAAGSALAGIAATQGIHAYSAYNNENAEKATITSNAPGKTYEQAITDAPYGIDKSVDPYFAGTVSGKVDQLNSTFEWSVTEGGVALVGSALVFELFRRPRQSQVVQPPTQETAEV